MKPSQKSPIDYAETNEQKRLNEARERGIPWKKWGPYLSERQWGTVREDYSDERRMRGTILVMTRPVPAPIAGEKTAWRESPTTTTALLRSCSVERPGPDPERATLFGLTNSEGNHGEDVKEYYFYLDSTPTHSYMKYLYKYPQQEFPYRDLVETNGRRSREELEYELLDTGVFDSDRYFDVFVEYAKTDPEDVLIQISVHNRGPETATDSSASDALVSQHMVVGRGRGEAHAAKGPATERSWRRIAQLGDHTALLRRAARNCCSRKMRSNAERLWGRSNPSPYVKDAFHDYVISGKQEAVNPSQTGTKAAAHYRLEVPAGGDKVVRLRLSAKPRTIHSAHLTAIRSPSRRCERILRSNHSAVVERGRTSRAPPGAGRDAVEQAVLLFRSRSMAGRA